MRNGLHYFVLSVSVVSIVVAGAALNGASRITRANSALYDSLSGIRTEFLQRPSSVLADGLRKTAEFESLTATASLRASLDSITRTLQVSRKELEQVRAERQRVERDSPPAVDLDSLNRYYDAKWPTANDYANIESFETTSGTISFSKGHFTFAYVPSTKQAAFIRIGKENDAFTSREVIQAWLRETAEHKVQQGYTRQYSRRGSAEYGEYQESLLRRGDDYLKTYFRYSRVQGTYDRYSLQYDYYVEVGSVARAAKYRSERLASRIGT